MRRTRADGASRVLNILKVPFFNDKVEGESPSKVAGVVCIATDVTDSDFINQQRDLLLARQKMILESTPDVMQYKDAQGRWVFANSRCLGLFGVEGVDWEGKTDSEIAAMIPGMPPNALDHCVQTDLLTWQKGVTDTFTEAVWDPLTGELAHFDVIKKPIYENGDPQGLLVICRDISRLHKAKQDLAAGRDKLHAILEALPDNIFIHDAQHRIVECFSGHEPSLKHPLKTIKGQVPSDLVEPEAASSIEEGLYSAVEKGQLAQVSYTLNVDGEPRSYVSRIVLFGSDWAIRLERDVTRQTAQERDLQTLRKAVESSPAGFVITDAEARIQFANATFCDSSGYSREELAGENPRIVKSDTHDKAFFKQMWQQITSGKNWRGEFCNRHRDGSLYWNDAIIIPIQEDTGQITSYVSIQYDITEKKEQSMELEQQKQAAEAASRAKSDFLSMMSHELRSPLHGLLGMIELSRERVHDKEALEMLSIAERSGWGLMRNLKDILDLASATVESPLAQESFEVRVPLDDALRVFRHDAERKGVLLHDEVRLPHGFCAVGDEYKLRLITFALLSNAIKFTEKGHVRLLAEMTATEPGTKETLKLIVEDTGIGIAESSRKAIFDAFEQLDQGLTRRFGGAGIGLSLVQQFIQMLHGDIAIDSTQGVGSRFTVTIPMESASCVADTQDLRAEDPAKQPSFSNRLVRVLYAEDERVNQMAVQRYLRGKGFEVEVANDGQQAVSMVQQHAYDIVLMDINMPNMDGIEAMRNIRGLVDAPTANSTPVIAVTAYSNFDERERFLELGFNEFVAKPVEMARLLEIVTNILAKGVQQHNAT